MGIAGPIASATGNFFGAREQSRAADRATQAQSAAAAESIAEQRRQFDLTRADQLPWLESGRTALGQLDRAAAGDLSGFYNAPDYTFRRDEGMRDIGGSFAARGGAFSGNALKALTQFNQNLAAGSFGDWWNRTAGRAGVGQTTATNLGNLGAGVAGNIGNINQNLASGIGQNAMYAANARASGIQNTNQAFLNADQNRQNLFGYFMGGGFGG